MPLPNRPQLYAGGPPECDGAGDPAATYPGGASPCPVVTVGGKLACEWEARRCPATAAAAASEAAKLGGGSSVVGES